MVKAERTCLEGSDKMAKVNRIEPKIPTLKKRQKVVSAQVSYYNEMIQANPEGEFSDTPGSTIRFDKAVRGAGRLRGCIAVSIKRDA